MTRPGANIKGKRRKIAFIGNFGQRNLGNEATLQAILHHLKGAVPDAEMTCISTTPEVAAATYGIAALPIHDLFVSPQLLQGSALARLVRKVFIGIPAEIRRWIRAGHVLRDTDMLILPGTQFLSDNLTGPWDWPYLAFRWSLAAKLRGCKLLFVSVGAGPLRHPLSRFFIRSSLRLADFRSFRDQDSKDYVRSIGLSRPDDPVYPDLAFSLSTPALPPRGTSEAPRPTVAVGVKDYHGQYGPWPRELSPDDTYRLYITRMSAFIAWLLEHRYCVRLVIGDVSYDTQVRVDIRKALRDAGVHPDEGQLIDEPIETLDALIRQLAASDIVVSPRFHNIIFGLLLSKPVLAVSYHDKFPKLLQSVDLDRFSVPIDEAEAATLIERFRELDRDRDELARQIRTSVDRCRAALDRQYHDILKLLASGPHRA